MTTAPPAETAPVRPGEELDWPALDAYLRANLAEVQGESTSLQFPNGSANLTYLLRFGVTELVLRRPPFGTVAPGAHDMKREYRRAVPLWRIFDRAPRAYLFCDDHAVIGADFVVMERRGARWCAAMSRRPWPATPTSGGGSRSPSSTPWPTCTSLDPGAAGLDDARRPDGFVERQVDRVGPRWDLVEAPPTGRR